MDQNQCLVVFFISPLEGTFKASFILEVFLFYEHVSDVSMCSISFMPLVWDLRAFFMMSHYLLGGRHGLEVDMGTLVPWLYSTESESLFL